MSETKSEGRHIADSWLHAEGQGTYVLADRIDAALRRAKAEVSLVWTEEPPETPGKYWWRLHSDYEPEIMSVLAYADGTAMRPCDYGHWAGPIALPLDARAAQIEEGE